MNLEEMEKRLKALEDIEEIKSLQREYVFYVCNHQWDKVVDFFAEGATAYVRPEIGTCNGKEEIAKLYTEVVGKAAPKDGGHFVSQPVIAVDGDTAKGRWLMYLFFPNKKIQWIQARFDMEYVRVNGRWKFRSLKYTRPWPSATHDHAKETG
jgi:ketosteroid isomerase-like protein